ncbi:MAG: phosphotransacetylase [Sporomusa sp.]|nr:phosphotransacetylase [Sporomusa sp.]
MIRNFSELVDKAKNLGEVTISVAAAQDEEVLAAIKTAYDKDFIDAILIGDTNLISPIALKLGLPADIRIIHEPDMDKAALTAASLVSNGEAQVLMKGLINSSNFLRAALNPENGLRSGRILSHFAAFEIPGEKKLAYHVDGGMNIAPSLEQKKEILISAIETLKIMGINQPKVAVLASNEQVNPKMPATVDAKALVDMAAAGELPSCIIEGPIAMDVAASAEAAKHKGIESKIAGDVDIFLVPTIEAGNMVGKTLVNYAKAKIAGMIIGAKRPIIMVSRSDSAEAKLYSIAMACLALERKTV